MDYLLLPRPLILWLPIYKVKLSFHIANLDDTLDALPLLIIYMLHDHKNLQDISIVTKLSLRIINEEINQMTEAGLLDTDLNVAPPGLRILRIYQTTDKINAENQPFYVDVLTRKLHMLREDDILYDTLPVEKYNIYIKNDKLSTGISKILLGNTYETVNQLLAQRKLNLNSNEFSYTTYIGERKYLKKYITHIPIFTPESNTATNREQMIAPIPCEIPYNLLKLRIYKTLEIP